MTHPRCNQPAISEQTRVELEELAARVEKAEGPDRELDGCIWWATLSPDMIEHLDRTGYVRECITRYGSAGSALQQFFDSSNPICLARIAFEQAYLASLDAARTLVPKGFSFEVRSSCTGDKGQATVWDPMRAPGMRDWRVTGCASPEIALVAASLRARAAVGEG